MSEKQQLETGNATTALVRWADADPSRRRLRYLAALALRESGWTLEAIGQAFGHPRGHVTRMLRRCRELVQEDFEPPELDEECRPPFRGVNIGHAPRPGSKTFQRHSARAARMQRRHTDRLHDDDE